MEPTNGELGIMIAGIKEDTGNINAHLKTLNEKVVKNTHWRIQARTYFKVIGFVMMAIIVPIVVLWVKKIIGV